MIKKIFLLLISSFFYTVYNVYSIGDDEATFLSRKQLQEDMDYFFEILAKMHPDVYHFCDIETFEKKKYNLLSQLKDSLSLSDFFYLISNINSCLDPHTGFDVTNYYSQSFKKKIADPTFTIFPEIIYMDNKIFIIIGDTEVEVTEINGINIKEILFAISQRFHRWPSNVYKLFFESFFSIALSEFFNITPPYFVSYKTGLQINTIEIKGISSEEFTQTSLFPLFRRELSPIDYEIYPSSSIALLQIKSFIPEILDKSKFSEKLGELKDSLFFYNIENLFVDVTFNRGGKMEKAYELLDIIEHDTIIWEYSEINRIPESLNTFNPAKKTIIRPPNTGEKLYNKNLFVLQGTCTFSAADYFCRIVKKNQLGMLIGEDTGTRTKDITVSIPFLILPNSKINFRYATGYRSFECDFKSETTSPDVFWETDSKRYYTEEELLTILKKISNLSSVPH